MSYVKSTAGLIIVGLLMSHSSSSAQEKKTSQPKEYRGVIQFQRVKTNGTSILIESVESVPGAKPEKQIYTVKVPVKTPKGIEFVKQERTRIVRPTRQVSKPVTFHHVFRTMAGKEIPKAELIGKLGMGDGKFVVVLLPGQTMPPSWKQLLQKDTITMQLDPTRLDPTR